jgi:hypothetical protein
VWSAIVCFLLSSVVSAGAAGWIMRDQTARRSATEHEVSLAMQEARELQSQKRWVKALDAVKRAQGILAGDTSGDWFARLAQARKDLEMVLLLEELRFQPGSSTKEALQKTDASYAKAFQDYGIDVDALEPQTAAESIRASSIQFQLTTALDTWADHRNNQVARNEPGWKRLLDVAQAADPDPWRNQVRQALRQGDRAALNQLAASANVPNLPLESLFLLIYRGRLDDVVRKTLLREAQHEHPDDFWINFQLGWDDYSSDKDLIESVRFFTAAVTARPGNASSRYFLADALRQVGRPEDSLKEYRKAARRLIPTLPSL